MLFIDPDIHTIIKQLPGADIKRTECRNVDIGGGGGGGGGGGSSGQGPLVPDKLQLTLVTTPT